MDRMAFVPGPEARQQIFDAQGHLFFGQATALDFADKFVLKAPAASELGPTSISILYQTMLACLSRGDVVNIYFGLRYVDPHQGEASDPSGELVGYTWATLKTANGAERHLWEVGRRTPPSSDADAVRAFNAYRAALAASLEQTPPPPTAPPTPTTDAGQTPAQPPAASSSKPAMSRALAPSNLYFASGRMWYFVDMGLPEDDAAAVPFLSRPLRSFDALILATLMALIRGRPPLVFGVSNHLDGLGQMPSGFTRASYEADERLLPAPEKPILVL